jgi:Contractile injection system tube protein/LysM domain
MELAKLTITPKDTTEIDEFEVLFNPNTYSISKSLTWNAEVNRALNASTLGFGGSTNRDLTLELFYDVTETPGSDVRTETNKVVALTRLKRDGQEPPLVQITWGDGSQDRFNFPFIGVVSQLTQRFTLFRADGRPVRATLNVTFKEFLNTEIDQHETDPEFTTRMVKRGDSMSSIAAEVYRDPALWRVIAEANQLDDPRHLPVGLRLNIPKLN